MWSARVPAGPGLGGLSDGPAWRRHSWRALAGTCLAAAVMWVGLPVSLGGESAPHVSAGGVGPVAGVSLVSAVLPGRADQQTYGTLAASPNVVNAGSSQTFTLLFTATTASFENGMVILQVPAGWPAPQTENASSDGYTTATTCTACTLATEPSAMKITGVTLAPQG